VSVSTANKNFRHNFRSDLTFLLWKAWQIRSEGTRPSFGGYQSGREYLAKKLCRALCHDPAMLGAATAPDRMQSGVIIFTHEWELHYTGVVTGYYSCSLFFSWSKSDV
jgi:hypothetical protein